MSALPPFDPLEEPQVSGAPDADDDNPGDERDDENEPPVRERDDRMEAPEEFVGDDEDPGVKALNVDDELVGEADDDDDGDDTDDDWTDLEDDET